MTGRFSTFRLIAAVLAGLFMLAGASGGARAAEGEHRCISDWTEAARIVRSEKLVDVKDVQALARQRLRGELIRVTLCTGPDEGTYAYRLVVFDQAQGVRTLMVDARNPFSAETRVPGSSLK